MLKRPPKKELDADEPIFQVERMFDPGPGEQPKPLPIEKAETWIYSEKARRLKTIFSNKEETDFDMSYADFGGMDLSGKNLRDVSFKESHLMFVNFEGTDLSGVDFSGADLRRADLKGANLAGADFRGANLEGANLTGADLTGAVFDDATLIKEARLPHGNRPEELERLLNILKEIEKGGIDIHKLPVRYLKYVNLRGMDVTGLDLSGIDINDLDLAGVDLTGAVYDARKAHRMDLSEAHLRWRQYKGNRPLVKRWYDFPTTFGMAKSAEKEMARTEHKEVKEESRPRAHARGPRVRVRKRVRVKS